MLAANHQMKVLLVQRSLTHYRKLLLRRISAMTGIHFDVFVMSGNTEDEKGLSVRVFPSKTRRFSAFGKSYAVVNSAALVRETVKMCGEYDALILEGATNIVVDIALRGALKGKNPYIIWDAGRRRNASLTPLRVLAQRPLLRVWRDAAAIMAYSTLAKDYFVDQGIDPKKIFVCQNTLSVVDFDQEIASVGADRINAIRDEYAPNGPLILYVGAIESRKRVEDLVRSFALVKKTNPEVSLLVIGGGDDLKRVKDVASELSCDGITFTGPIINGVIAYFMACDLFVLPSEGGLSLNQAMICSKPVIASSADGTELDLIEPGKNGFLFSEGDVDQLAEQIRDAIMEPSRLAAMGKRSREIIDERANEALFAQNLIRCISYVKGMENSNG